MMKYKTFWSISAVTRNANKEGMRESDWILAKQREYERASGVKWSVSPQGDGWTFLPAVDQRITLPSEVPPEIVARVTEAYQTTKSPLGYVSYFDVAEESGLSLRQVMEAVRYLVKQGQAHPTVDRMGNNVYFKVKTGDRMASLKTFRELEGELSPIAQHHHLRLVCDVCGNTQTCKCSEPKETYHGICNECAKKQRQASEKVGPGDSDLAFELATEIPRTDKVLRATFSKSFRKGPPAMLKAISRLEEPYVTLRRQSRWLDGAEEPWKEVSVNDAKQLIILGKKLRKNLSKLLRENKIAADQQYDTDYLPRRQISPDNKWEMPDMGEEPVSEITHCQHSVNPMERGKHLMMSRELLKVAKDLLATSQKIGAFSVADKFGLAPLEMEALEGALSLAERTLSSVGLGRFAGGDLEVGDYGSSWVAQYKKSGDIILLNGSRLIDRSGKIPRFMALKHLYHEIGHRVFSNLSAQWQSWYEFEFESSGKKSVSSYGSTSYREDFAEIFAKVCLGGSIPAEMKDRFETVINKAK